MDLSANFSRVRAGMEQACARAGRDPASVRLLAVSKGQPPAAIEEAARLGQTLFGESKVQEAKAKIGLCSNRLSWHLIGHLQSNKARDAVHFFQMIQSIDSVALAQEVNKWADKAAQNVRILLEVNVAGESTKFGFQPDALLQQLIEINALPRLEIYGLMTIAPWTSETEKVRPIFRRLRELKEKCEQLIGAPLTELSMGMSGDYEVAIEEGSTLVRVGTALFGPRQTSPQRQDGATQ